MCTHIIAMFFDIQNIKRGLYFSFYSNYIYLFNIYRIDVDWDMQERFYGLSYIQHYLYFPAIHEDGVAQK